MILITLNRRLPLFLLLVLTVGQVNAQSGLRAVGPPVHVAGKEGVYFMNPRWAPSGDQIAYTGAEYKGLWLSDPDEKTPLMAEVETREQLERLNSWQIQHPPAASERLLGDLPDDLTHRLKRLGYIE